MALLDRIRALGTPLAADALEPSDSILPRADADLDEVRSMMTGEGATYRAEETPLLSGAV